RPRPVGRAAPDDLSRRPADAQRRLPHPEPRRPPAALHALDHGLEGSAAQTDIYVVSTADGLPSTKQLTYTTGKNEGALAWMRDSASFLFLSNREAPENASGRNQLYLMRHDGGEARRITDAREGVADFALSDD